MQKMCLYNAQGNVSRKKHFCRGPFFAVSNARASYVKQIFLISNFSFNLSNFMHASSFRAIKPVESNGECDHAQINHTLGKSVVQNDVEENAFNTRIRTTPRTEAKLLNEAFETTKSFSNYGTPTMMSQFPTLKSPSSYKLQGFRPVYKSNYNRNTSRFRFLSLLMLGIIFRVLLEFQLFQTFVIPFAVCFAFYELIVLTRKWITYPNGGYLVCLFCIE